MERDFGLAFACHFWTRPRPLFFLVGKSMCVLSVVGISGLGHGIW